MAPMDTPEKLARFFVRMGYHENDRKGCERELLEKFPHADPVAVMEAAIEEDRADEEDLDRVITEDQEAARRAEHDVGKSMHGKRGA